MLFVLIRNEVKMKRNFFGFTLIELLVVISIIGILASLALVSFTGAQKQARDTQRRSDLNQVRNALENYAGTNNGIYPKNLGTMAAACTELMPNFISACPEDPTEGETYGFYSSLNGDGYVIYAGLEAGNFWEVCSTGKSGKVEGEPTDSTCDLT